MNRYQVYGLVLKSAYPLVCANGGLPKSADSVAEVELARGTAADFSSVRSMLDGKSSEKRWFQRLRLLDGRDYLGWPKLFEFLIANDGHTIIGHALNGTSRETFETYLLSQVLSFALLRLGIEPLHATTVAIQGKAVAFLGDCGYGKSTLAAACLREEFPVLTDDLLVLRQVDGQSLAYPGPPRIKLMPNVARWLLGRRAHGVPMNPLTSKRIVPLEAHQYASLPVPLHAIYVLRPSRVRSRVRIAIRRLSARAAWCELTKGTFNLSVRDPDRLRRLFAWACQLAQRIPVKSLSYPRRLTELRHVVRAIAFDVASLALHLGGGNVLTSKELMGR